MAERRIDPKFNIHKEYKRMFIMNPYRNGSSDLLLDNHGGAKAAYSLNRLRTSYTGSAIRVRRLNDDAEMNIGFNGNLFDTTTLMSFAGGNSINVTIWYDQSGNGNNFTQERATRQPRIVNSGTLETDGGKPCIYFNGEPSGWILESLYNISNTFSLFTVQRIMGSRFSVYNGISMAANNYRMYYGNGIGIYRLGYGRNYYDTTEPIGNQDLLSITADGENASIYTNSTFHLTTTGALPGTPTGNFSLGGINGLPGQFSINQKVQEMIIYESNMASSRASIENDMKSRYSIT